MSNKMNMEQLEKALNNEYFLIGMAICVTIYASRSQVELPTFMKKLFKNDIFRVMFLSTLLMANFKKAPHVAVAIALIFIVTMNGISNDEIHEQFETMESFRGNIKNGRKIN
jgi:hypothetical protein